MPSILIVDDDIALARVLQRGLQQAFPDFHVETASNGLAALRRVREQAFDLMITDILMPEQDGLGAIGDLRREAATTKVIAMSGGGQFVGTDVLTIAKALGAREVLNKPFKHAELVAAVRRVLAESEPPAALPRKSANEAANKSIEPWRRLD